MGKRGSQGGKGSKREGGGGGDTLSCCVTCCYQSAKRLCCPCANQSIVERFQYNCIQNSLTWYKFKNQQQQATNHNHLPSKMKCKTMAAFLPLQCISPAMYASSTRPDCLPSTTCNNINAYVSRDLVRTRCSCPALLLNTERS